MRAPDDRDAAAFSRRFVSSVRVGGLYSPVNLRALGALLASSDSALTGLTFAAAWSVTPPSSRPRSRERRLNSEGSSLPRSASRMLRTLREGDVGEVEQDLERDMLPDPRRRGSWLQVLVGRWGFHSVLGAVLVLMHGMLFILHMHHSPGPSGLMRSCGHHAFSTPIPPSLCSACHRETVQTAAGTTA